MYNMDAALSKILCYTVTHYVQYVPRVRGVFHGTESRSMTQNNEKPLSHHMIKFHEGVSFLHVVNSSIQNLPLII